MCIVLLWLDNGTEDGFLTALRRRDGSLRTFPSEGEANDFMLRYDRPNLSSSLVLPIE